MVLPKFERVQNKIPEKIHVPINTNKVTKSKPFNIEVTGGWSVKARPKKYLFSQDFFLPFMLGFTCMLAVSLMVYLTLHNKITSLRNLKDDFMFTKDEILRRNEQLQVYMREIVKNNEIITQDLRQILGSDAPVMLSTKFLECLRHNCDSLKKGNWFSKYPAEYTPNSFQIYKPFRRSKRSDNEANVEYKDKRKNRRNRTKTIETVAVQFKAYDPDGYARNPLEGALGPWWESSKDGRNMESLGLKLMDHRRKLEISKKGLYFIYSQVTYQTMNVTNSYSINIISSSDKSNTPLSTCSSFGKLTVDGEISCYTSVIQFLNPGDVVYLQQSQPNRVINFSDSYTFVGLMFLGGS